jgi:transcriptional regulator with XRE-family HTH domain
MPTFHARDWYKKTPLHVPRPRPHYIKVRRVVGLRRQQGWSIAEAAARLGVSPQVYGAIEVLSRVQGHAQLDALARLYGVTPAHLCGEGLGPWTRPDLMRPTPAQTRREGAPRKTAPRGARGQYAPRRTT